MKKYSSKRIIGIGAGGTCRDFIRQHMDKMKLLSQIDFLLDNNKKLAGTDVQVGMKFVKVEYLPDFDMDEANKDSYIIFLLIGSVYALSVLQQLDQMQCFDELVCIYGLGTFQWGYTYFPEPYTNETGLPLPKKNYQIPRKIHYCWFGPNEMPQKDKQCVKSWKKYNPDYEVIRWDENSYDITASSLYVQEAYEAGKYAFVSDYVRLEAVWKHGGFYLDTDVELFRSLDILTSYRMVFAYMEYGEIGTGLGFAAVQGAGELAEMLQEYKNIPFKLADDGYNLTPCPRYTNEFFRRRGIRPDNVLRIREDILFLPSDFLCPLSPVLCEDGTYQLAQLAITENTIGIHWCNNSWKNSEELGIFTKSKLEREIINQRLLADWKRMERID